MVETSVHRLRDNNYYVSTLSVRFGLGNARTMESYDTQNRRNIIRTGAGLTDFVCYYTFALYKFFLLLLLFAPVKVVENYSYDRR